MPTYEYQCDDCGHNFDEFQMFSEAPLTVCPKCGKTTLRRVFGAGAAIIFKGSGFYQTDYRSESYKSAAKADKDSAGSSASGSSGSTGDAKPAAPAAGTSPPAAPTGGGSTGPSKPS